MSKSSTIGILWRKGDENELWLITQSNHADQTIYSKKSRPHLENGPE